MSAVFGQGKGRNLSGIGKSGRIGLTALAALAVALGTAQPAAAQYSAGYKFLQAVDKKEGTQIIDMLAKSSTLINSRDISTGRTALHIVIDRRDQTWLDFLLAKGADPNLADNKGTSPLLLACRIGLLSAVPALVKAGARVDEASSTGETPLISAVQTRNVALLSTLLKAGADPDKADNSGRTARDYAKLEGAQSPVMVALQRDAKPPSQRGAGGSYGPS